MTYKFIYIYIYIHHLEVESALDCGGDDPPLV